MGKHDKKKEYCGINCAQIADQLENYVDAATTMLVIEGQSEEDHKWAIKVVKKNIKNLRKGRPDKVFSEEMLENNDLYY